MNISNSSHEIGQTFARYLQVMDLIHSHNKLMEQTLNLVASENTVSPSVLTALASDLNSRVAEGWIGERYYPGMHYYDCIEKIGIEVAKELFGYEFVDLRPISGTMANMAVFTALTQPGDVIMSTSINDGAHFSMSGQLPKKVFRLKVENISYDPKSLNINTEESMARIQSLKPKMIFLGGSALLFPQPLKELCQAAHEVGAIVVYDAAHVAGLIASGEFQRPYEEGVDIVTLTTCKTIPGPQGGIILAKTQFAAALKKAIFPTLLSGHHLNETAGKVIALLEIKAFGKQYSEDTINNAQRLGCELKLRGFDVLNPESVNRFETTRSLIY